jgi:Holliday junction DNA helicase RuvB
VIVTYLAGETPFPVLAGDQVVQLPNGWDYQSYSVLDGPDGPVVEPLGPNTHNVYRKARETVTDFSQFASRLGVRMTPRPEPTPPAAGHDAHSRATRPLDLDTMVGQDHLRLRLKVHVLGHDEGEPVGHILLEGPAGLGKTSMAMLVAGLTGGRMRVTSGTALKSPELMADELGQLRDGDVLFVDEVHALGKPTRAALLTAMEDYRVDLVGQSHMLRRFVLVAATAEPGSLDRPMLDRFSLRARMDYYSLTDLGEILHREADTRGWKVEPEAVESLARRSRGTPRVAKELLKSARRFAKADADGDPGAVVTEQAVSLAFELAGIDEHGLEKVHRSILWQLCKVHKGGPVGVDRLAMAADTDPRSLREAESYLIRAHFLVATGRGRVATDAAYSVVGMEPRPGAPKAADLAQLESEI